MGNCGPLIGCLALTLAQCVSAKYGLAITSTDTGWLTHKQGVYCRHQSPNVETKLPFKCPREIILMTAANVAWHFKPFLIWPSSIYYSHIQSTQKSQNWPVKLLVYSPILQMRKELFIFFQYFKSSSRCLCLWAGPKLSQSGLWRCYRWHKQLMVARSWLGPN